MKRTSSSVSVLTTVPTLILFINLENSFKNYFHSEDDERDRFWDHEIEGRVVSSASEVDRNLCAKLCSGNQEKAIEHSKAHRQHPFRQEKPSKDVVLYSWKSDNEKDMDSAIGRCDCISVLHSIKLSFGSFAGLII